MVALSGAVIHAKHLHFVLCRHKNKIASDANWHVVYAYLIGISAKIEM